MQDRAEATNEERSLLGRRADVTSFFPFTPSTPVSMGREEKIYR